MTNSRIVVVGSLNVDSVVTVDRFPRAGETVPGHTHELFPGGKGGNQAAAAAKLTPPGTVAMLGQVGGDAHGGWLRDHLVRTGVDVRGLSCDESTSSGTAIIATDAGGQNQIVIVAGANGTFTPARLDQVADAIAGAAYVLLQLEIPGQTVLEAARRARAAGACVILDPAPAGPLPDGLLQLCDYVTPNEAELTTLTGQGPTHRLTRSAAVDGARRLRGARQVIVKLGAAGALLVTNDEVHEFAPFPVTPVDTTAAGDCWNGAFAAALLGGQSPLQAGRFACAAAALSVTRAGAQPSMPNRDAVDALLTPG